MLKKLELSDEDHFELQKYAQLKGIAFLSTPFDVESLYFLRKKLRLPIIKIASGELTNAPLLLEAAKSGAKLILSTGMCTISDIESALGVVAFGLLTPKASPTLRAFQKAFRSKAGQKLLAQKVTLLHCVTDYPAAPADANLLAIQTIQTKFKLPTGYSDHSLGLPLSLAAIAMGACMIEKHFTLDKNMPGPDHLASLDPQELKLLVRGIRDIELALGTGKKIPSANEKKNRLTVRRSLVTTRAVRRGEHFGLENLGVKRPGTGLSPLFFWDYLGKKSPRNYAAHEVIKSNHKKS
jgi:N-acetylneuraminate synthase